MRPDRRVIVLNLAGRACAAALVAAAGLPSLAQKPEQTQDVVVFAAASLKTALDAANSEWEKSSGKKATISYAASSALAKQIEQAAPATVFISADIEWMDYLAGKDLIAGDTRVNLLGNKLVLIVPKDQGKPVDIKAGFDLAGLLGADGRLAVGEVKSVPAGKYAKAALEKLGLWAAAEPRLAQAENVRAALTLVSRGEAAAGIVYHTDAIADPGVTIIGTFPPESHAPIIYPVAATKSGKNAATEAFLAFLRSAKAKPIFEKQGFTMLQVGS